MACLLCEMKDARPQVAALSTLVLAKRNSTTDILDAMCAEHRDLATQALSRADNDPLLARPIRFA